MSFKDLEGQLARWSERLQQYDFQVIYRNGILHGNADALSRRPCKILLLGLFLAEDNGETWRQEQLEDPSIAIILQGKETGIRPSWQEIASRDASAKIYWSYWDSLELRNGVLYKRWEAPNLRDSIAQLVVPKGRIQQILEQAHDSPSGGHFGISKTLEKIRKRFYWASCKQDVETKFVTKNQRDWDRWIPMYLLAYRSSKRETTGVTPAELYFAQDLRLPIDLLRGNPPVPKEQSMDSYLGKIKRKLEGIHDQKTRRIHFEIEQKVWLYNPRRVKGKAPKLQSSWEGPYYVVKKLSDVVYCIRKSNKCKNKIVHTDRLAPYCDRQEERE
ncbi:PREDICTED: uncharacterized protein LOC108770849 [Trachymyrmex cornetzi]|uniref:uncharacterized protein LOC108770849 n=1 Tax=Trachymyrmex cornetzi TaxID=471704 RepID=UPI00084F235F|nr:PREDICTED: uncharacterized protein LOC108770849 [Trachymyrmex cornetzi]